MELDAEMSSVMTERFNVAGAMVAKLYGRPDEEAASFGGKAGRVRDVGVTVGMYGTVFRVALGLVAALATALVYGMGGVLTIDGAFEFGTLVALTTLLLRLYGPLTSLSNVHVDVMTALVSFDRVFEVLDLKPMVAEKPDARAVPRRARPPIEFDDVWFRYPAASEVSLASLESWPGPTPGPSRRCCDGVGFTARPGELIALVGHSGAGKTTITSPGLPPLRRQRRRGPDQRPGRARRHPGLPARHRGRGHAGRPPVPRHHRGQPRATPGRTRPRRRSGRR